MSTMCPLKSITVMGLQEARNASLEDFETVISIEDPDQEDGLRCAPGSSKQLILPFQDLEKMVEGVRCPQPNDIATALDFAKDVWTRDLLIHCNFGISRSPALALAFHIDLLGSKHVAEALNATEASANSWIDPNRLMVGHVDQMFKCQGRLLQHVREVYDGLR